MARVPSQGSEGKGLGQGEDVHTSLRWFSQCSPYTDGETEDQRIQSQAQGHAVSRIRKSQA